MTSRVFLLGYMGAGKTTLGKSLSTVLNLPFLDLDNYIEQQQQHTVKEIFALVGEAGFREIERQALHEVATGAPAIISLGGGTPCFFDNMEVVNQHGLSVYLKPSEEVLLKRLIKGKHKRPLLANKSDDEILNTIRQGLAQREPYYLQANLVFEASHLENKADIILNAQSLAKQLEALCSAI